jgi:hypothetical protein
MARLEASGTAAQPIGQETVSRLEAFLGIPNRSLPRDPVDNTFAANGSGCKLKVNVQAGDEISFDWMFDARDFVNSPPDGKADDDFAVFTVVGQGNTNIFKLSDVRQTGNQGATGWRSSVYTASSSGELTVGFAVVNDRIADNPASQNSFLLIDNVRLNRDFSEGYQIVDDQAAGRFETLIHT